MNALRHIPPPVYALLSLALCRVLDGLWRIPVDMSWPFLALSASLAGGGLMLWAWSSFLRARTTVVPTGQPSALVCDGPYRHTRNPMYLGVALLLTGIAFYIGSPVYLLAPCGFFLAVQRLFVPFEERRLEETFGDDYRRLLRETPRWLPTPWNRAEK